MRWKTKLSPQNGDKRTITKFAWLPVEVGNKTIWLEKYKEHQLYVHEYGQYTYYVTSQWYVIERELFKKIKHDTKGNKI